MPTAIIGRLCDEFWRRAGELSDFPRDLDGPIAFALPLVVISLPSLLAADLQRWLRGRGLEQDTGPQRRLHACVVAHRGAGYILLDGRDPPAQRRFSLAHEAGHFIADYLEPRRRLLQILGPSFQSVLDGKRPPDARERVEAVLVGVPLDLHLHLMERGGGGFACGSTSEAECLADNLALELLAPEAAVYSGLRAIALGRPYPEREQAAEEFVRRTFGLPDPLVGRYARRLLRRQTGGPDTREWLGLAGC
ncbi:MAG: ImmA/IrrE family metallo-endopeptidase [Dehalococcoidia bacterium]